MLFLCTFQCFILAGFIQVDSAVVLLPNGDFLALFHLHWQYFVVSDEIVIRGTLQRRCVSQNAFQKPIERQQHQRSNDLIRLQINLRRSKVKKKTRGF